MSRYLAALAACAVTISAALYFSAGLARATGSVTVAGFPSASVPRTLKGGTGINIGTDGTLSATGEVPVSGVITYANISTALRGKLNSSTSGNLVVLNSIDGGAFTDNYQTQPTIDGGSW